ncbi:hypothetical protein HON15_00250 [Candidatus Woesearchaeota archaeon]|nr:hypothetical protein [Candidatus Woesearchaeota archaeon]
MGIVITTNTTDFSSVNNLLTGAAIGINGVDEIIEPVYNETELINPEVTLPEEVEQTINETVEMIELPLEEIVVEPVDLPVEKPLEDSVELPVTTNETLEEPEESTEPIVEEPVEEETPEEPIENSLTGGLIVDLPVEEPIILIINETTEEPLIINETVNDTENILILDDLIITAFSGNGTGTFANPYNISNCTQLQEMENDVGANFSLTNNINCSDTVNWNSGSGFDPVGSNSPKFVGSLNGNNYNITKLFISRTTTYNGLFGYLGTPANISSFGLINASIKGGQYTGGLTGYMDGSTSVNNINVTGGITGTSSYVAGLVARALTGSTIDNCYFAGNVTGGSYTGGLVGYLQGNVNNSGVDGRIITGADGGGFMGAVGGNVWNSYASTETVTSSTSYDEVGGFVGTVFSGANITNSYATGNVSGDQDIGGFVGEINSGGTGLISNCYTTSNVYGRTRDIGGFVGVYWAGTDINNSYARGNVTGTGSTSYVGGFVGEPVLTSPATTISNSYSTGNLSGMSSTSGGFAGYMTSAFSCENIFFDNQTSKKTDRGSGNCIGTGKNTSDMKNVSTFTATATTGLTTPWDFVNNPNNDTSSLDLWDIDSVTNDGYPVLSGIGVGATIGTPTVTLNSPADNYIDQELLVNVTFNCSATDSVALENLSLYISDFTNSNIILNQTTAVNGTSNSTTWSLNLINGTYTWKCEVQDPDGNTRETGTRTLTIGDVYVPVLTYVLPTLANASSIVVTNVEVNVTINDRNLNEVKFNWNGTNHTIYNDSLVLMYNFDNLSALGENHTYVVDVSGNNNNGTSVNEAGSLSSGKYGGAFDFDGTLDYVDAGNGSNLQISSSFAISLWVYIDSYSGGDTVLVGKTDLGSLHNYYFDIENDGQLFLGFYDGSTWKSSGLNSGNIVGTGSWNNVVGVFDDSSNTITTYINGVQNTQATSITTSPSPTAAADDEVRLGSQIGSAIYFNGSIDEVRIWNISLSSEDIYEHYVSNLKKINNTAWEFYINQSKNATDVLSRSTFTYYVSAKDVYGYQSQTNVTTVIVDGTGPTFSVFANQTTEYGTDFSYDIDATDPSGVSCFVVNDSTNFKIDCDGILQNNTILNVVRYWLNITVNDTNNFQTSEVFWVNVSDTTSPTISIIYPTNGSNTTNTLLNVNFTTSDLNLDSCWYSNDTMLSNITLANCGANLTSITWSEINHTVTIWANDTYGNENSSEITFNVDLTSPTFSAITNQSILQKNSLSYDINANDTFGMSCFVVNDTQFKISCTGLLENNTALSVGTYVVNITANDTVNNEAYNLIQVDVTTTPAIGLTLDSPTLISVNVTQNRSFTVQVTVSCFNANCGEVNVSLDPYPVDGINADEYDDDLSNNADIVVLPYDEQDNVETLNLENLNPPSDNNLKLGDGLTTLSAISLFDNHSFTYDIQDGCDIADGQSDVFDGGLKLYINNTEYTGTRSTTEDDGREAFCNGQTRSLLNISRKVYVPKTANWSRYLDVLHNPTAGTVCVDVNISSNMGSDGSDFMNTSDNNKSWELTDHWMMWDDTNIAAGDDAAGFVYQQDGASETIDSLKPVTASGGLNKWGWGNVCVGAGSTKILMHFFTQRDTRAQSEAESTDIYNNFNDAEHLSGMSDAEKTQVVNWEISSTKSGLVSTNTSATPFYTTTTNPYNLTLNAGESETITFTINATGTVNQTYEFFVYTNMTSDMAVMNQTSVWNVTIINDTIGVSAPSISILYPIANSNHNTNVTAINYSFSTTQIINECWASTDSGVTNTSKVTAGINFTGLVSTTDSNTWTVYCDDNNSLTGTGTVTFIKQPVLSLAWVTPTKNINVTQNKTFTVSATLTCTNTDCNNVNVTLDPVGTPVSCKELYSQGSVTDGEYTIYPDGVTAVSVYCDMTRNDGGWTLFANMDSGNCAESLTFGNNNLTSPTSGQYFSKSLGGFNHTEIMVVLNDTDGYKFDFIMNFSNNKNLSQRFIDFVAGGENTSWTARDASNTYTGRVDYYKFSDGAGLTSSTWGSRSTLSADDGTWGVANATTLDGNGGPYLSNSVGSFGFENPNSGDSTCNGYYINGAKTTSSTWIANAYIRELTDYGTTAKSGTISTVNGTTPFYITTEANPFNISIAEGSSSTITWTVNATGDQNVTHEFFVYANWTSNQSVKAVTRIWNITISNSTTALGPTVSISSPTTNSFTTNTGLDILYTATSATLDSCWYTSNGGETNTTLANCINVTGKTWGEGETTVTIYANDTDNLIGTASVTFTIDLTNPTIVLIDPSNNTVSTDNGLNVNYVASDTNRDSCWYSDNEGSNTTLTNCANVTDKTWSVGYHDVTIWVNDSVNQVASVSANFTLTALVPQLNYLTPTPNNNTGQSLSSTKINLSLVDAGIDEIIYNWNGTNYTYYNDSLVLMYNFDNLSALGENDTHIYDISGNGNNGTATGDAKYNISGKYDGGFSFDGVSDAINAGNSASLNITKAVTLSAWVYMKAYGASNHVHIAGKTLNDLGSYANVNYYIGLKSKQPIFVIAGESSGTQATENADFPLNSWQHFVATWDGTTNTDGMKIYRNGIQTANQTSLINNIYGNTNNFYIGTSDDGFEFNGLIDNVMVWNRSLSAQEIYQQYASNLQKFNQTQWYLYVNQSKNATTVLTDGAYTYYASAKDVDGNENITDERTLTIDSSNPLISIVSPSNGTNTTDNTLDITYTVSDSSLQSCWYTNGTMLSNTTLVCGANITSVIWSEGEDTVIIWVNDTFGNINSTSVTFNVDSITPIITMISPDNNSNSSDNTLNVNYIATDTNRDSCWYSNDTVTSNTTLASCANITSVTWNDGQHNVTVWVNDTFGNSNSTSVTFNVDTTNPTLTITSPANNTNTNDNDLDVNFTITDDALQSCWYNDDNGPNTTLIDCANITTVNWIDGTHIINLWANDSVGNSNSASVTFVIDASSSTITFIDPTPSNAIAQTTTNVITNVSIIESNLNELKWNWNGTNYTMYNDSLVLMYNFDNVSALNENHTYVFDVSGNNNNGTSVNEAGSLSSGKYGGAFDFDGVNDRVTTPTTFGIGTTDFTISTWVNLDSASEGGAFVKIGGTSPNQGFAIGVGGSNYDDTGNDLILLYEGIRWIDTNNVIGTGWHHVAMTVDSSGYPAAYIDGVFTYSDATGTGTAPQQDITYIGGYTGSGAQNRHADVTIDEVRIWNRSLSTTEIYQQYASNLNRFNFTQWYLYVNQSQNATAVLTDSDYTYYASVKDSLENENITTTRTITIDSANPTITISSPTNGTNTTNTALNVNYIATDTNRNSCWYSNDTMTSNTTLTGCANITSVTWSVGNHNMTIWVNDTAGNKQNDFVTFTILPDIDNDGIDDTNDPLLYNESNVTQSGITKLNITVGGNRTNETYSGKQEILFYDQNTLMINFSHNFSSKNLDLSNVTIIKDTNYLIVNFSGQLQGNKTLFITDNSFITLCVKDAEVSSIDAVSSTCDEANETLFTSCLGNSNATTINGTTCTDLGTTIKIENLQYSAIRGTVATSAPGAAPGGGGGSGGGSGGGTPIESSGTAEAAKIPECQTDAECSPDKTCYYNQCVKLFDVKVLDVDSPIGDDGLLGFTYFIKGMADINGDVIVNFWLEKNNQAVSSGQDVIYLGSFEEKTEQTKIFVPQNLEPGAYEFYVQVGFENYQALSHRTIFVEEKDGLMEVRIDQPTSLWKMIALIIAGIICLLLIVILIIYLFPKFKRKEPSTYTNINQAKAAEEHIEPIKQLDSNQSNVDALSRKPMQRYYWDPKTKNIFRETPAEKPLVVNNAIAPWISDPVWEFSKWPKRLTLRKRLGNIFRERSRWSLPKYTSIKVKLLGRFHKKRIDWKHEGWR